MSGTCTPNWNYVRLEHFQIFCEIREQTKDSHYLQWHLQARAKIREEYFLVSYEEMSNLGAVVRLSQISAFRGMSDTVCYCLLDCLGLDVVHFCRTLPV